jgi:hypothetical protein
MVEILPLICLEYVLLFKRESALDSANPPYLGVIGKASFREINSSLGPNVSASYVFRPDQRI